MLRASDLVTFDNLVSGRELHAIEVRSRTLSGAEDGECQEGNVPREALTHTMHWVQPHALLGPARMGMLKIGDG